MIRAVIDTNVFISSLLSMQSPPARIRQAFAEGLFAWCLSEELFDEYRETLSYSKVQKALLKAASKAGSEHLAQLLLEQLEHSAIWANHPLEILPVINDDPDDDAVLATALSTNAQVIVTGDHHLLELEQYKGIPIITPNEFVLDQLRH